jgi:hypothetical protein
VRYGTYLAAIPALIVLAIVVHPLWWLALLAGLAAMLRGAYRRLRPHLAALPRRQWPLALAWVPLIRWSGDLAKMVGYPVGVWWRWHHAPAGAWSRRQW